MSDKIISDAVILLTKKYNDEYGVSCDLINQGDCESFAEELCDNLKEAGIVGEILSDGLFFDPFGDEPDEMMWDVAEYGNKPVDFNKIGLPSHYWFYYKGKHYDSDVPQGVADMFELPIIKKFYLKKRKSYVNEDIKLRQIVSKKINEYLFELDKGNRYFPKDLGQFIYHQTNYGNAIQILKHGFKSGYELDKGEKNNGIFFSPTDKGQKNVVYNRGLGNKLVMIEISTDGLNLFDTYNLPENPNLLSFQQDWYKTVINAKQKNIFPDGYDGILSRYDDRIYEIILKKDIANKNLTGRLKNLRGKYIETSTMIRESLDKDIYSAYKMAMEPFQKRKNDFISSIKSFSDIDDDKIRECLDYFGYEGFNNDEDAFDDLKKKVEFYKKMPNPVILYRAIGVRNKKMIKTNDLGEHYTPYKWNINGDTLLSIGYENWDEDVIPYVMEVSAPHSEIDIIQTIIQNLSFPNEWEINLKNKGMGANFIKTYRLKGF